MAGKPGIRRSAVRGILWCQMASLVSRVTKKTCAWVQVLTQAFAKCTSLSKPLDHSVPTQGPHLPHQVVGELQRSHEIPDSEVVDKGRDAASTDEEVKWGVGARAWAGRVGQRLT